MGKSNIERRYLHISYKQIITYMCYVSVIIGWQRFNCISLLGVMSMENLNGNNDLTTAEEAVNLSLISTKSVENYPDGFSSISSSSSSVKHSMASSQRLDFGTPNAYDNSKTEKGWQCLCWNTTSGYVYGEVRIQLISFG